MDGRLAACLVCVGALTFAGVQAALGGRRMTVAVPTGAWQSVIERLRGLPPMRMARDRSARASRKEQALRDLPGMMDVVTLGLSSGLSFDSSLELYCQRSSSVLADAFSEAMLSWRMGITGRDEALRSLAEELDVAALRRFAGAVSQALAFGSPLSTVLEQQAQAIREEQRSELEAEIERAPVKMLIPLGVLIVPAMLLSILGPLLSSSIGFM
ncbi:MAG: type II secretion system F family protein [Atopobiaceae bacterium]|nr:type II secretion system F family protein [Atopobiaceae bacterium]MBR1830667.1 type II secretion system F family protein [Atopobiaceae bacterium]